MSEAGLRVLIFSLNYHPEPTGSAPYMTRLARHLAGRHAVTVITGHPHYPSWRVQRVRSDYAANPRVIRYGHFVPSRPTTAGRALYEMSWLGSASRGLWRAARYDVVIAAIPTLAGGTLGLLAGRRSGAPVGVIFHDLIGPGASQSGVTSGGTARWVSSVEAFIARGAAQLAILCEDFRPYLESRGVQASRIARFRNWGRLGEPIADVEATRRRLGWSSSDFVCLHAGNMGQKQGLENIVSAARILESLRTSSFPPPSSCGPVGPRERRFSARRAFETLRVGAFDSSAIRVVLAGDGSDRANLSGQAQKLRLTNLSFLPVQPTGLYESMLAATDVLLLNQRAAVTHMSIPSKLTAYFAAGRPIVAAIDRDSAAAKEIERAQAGVVVPPGDPRALADAIGSLASQPRQRSALGRNGRRYAEIVLHADADLEDYDAFLARLLSPSPLADFKVPSPFGGGQGGGLRG